MLRITLFVVAMICAAAAITWAQAPGPGVKSESGPVEGKVFRGNALFVWLASTHGNAMNTMALEKPEFRTLGDRSFLVGHPLDQPINPPRVWTPIYNVLLMEEFADVKEMSKMHRLNEAAH